jgi:integration host factor subunit alpha
MALTKAGIVSAICDITGIDKKASEKFIETVIEIIKSTLESGEDVLMSGFGKFCVNQKKERKGRNPATGNDLMISPRKIVTFKCSGKLRTRMNKKKY